MKRIAITAVVIVFMSLTGSPALAAQTFEITADSTLNGNDGYLMQITEPGEGGSTMFLFEEAGKIRAFAERISGSSTWDIFSEPQYICQSTSMTVNDSWRFLDDEGEERVATVVTQESITTNAGTFSCYRVDIESATNPGTVITSLWFSSGVGLVREDDFYEGTTPVDWRFELQSFSLAGGSGFFPLAVGNVWQYGEIILPVEFTTWGAIKAKYN